MKAATLACSVVVAASATLLAQSPINGKWTTEAVGIGGADTVVMDFTADGAQLTGAITRTSPPGQKPVAVKGKVDKDTITFTVLSPDGKRTITFTGKVMGDEIVFVREAKGDPGAGSNQGGGFGIYGLNGPKTVTVKRVK
ncbi:MAG TPA: hypothetical protein VFO58_25105 [Vicinamibacterales bacterium]|nr:hypothetical protein [Vicinamibacterales bacterium]